MYFALKLENEGYISVEGINNFPLFGENEFTLSVQFFTAENIKNKKIVLLKQDKIFELGIDDQVVYFMVEGSEKITLSRNGEGDYLILDNLWYTVTITFDKNDLSVYLNGINCLESQLTTQTKTSMTCYEIAKNLNGYLRYVKMFNKCFSNTEVQANLFDENAQIDDTELFLDFSMPVPKDKGKYAKQIIYNNTNINKQVLQVKNNGKAKLKNSNKLNEVFFEKNFTVIFNIYPLGQEEHCKMMLLSNAKHDSENKFNITGFFQKGNVGNGRFGISVEYASSSANIVSVPINQWSQVAIVYDREKMKMYAYVNAELSLENGTWNPPESVCDGSIYVCSAEYDSDSREFDGYMQYLTVFQESLNNEQIKAYYDDISLLRTNKNLKSMYVCKKNGFIDIVDDSQAILTGDAYVKEVSFNNSWCNPTGLVYSLDVGERGYANVSDAEGFRKALLNKGSFSIYSKVFLDWRRGKSTLLTYVDDNDNTLLEIIFHKTATDISFNIIINESKYNTEPIQLTAGSSWVDIGFVYNVDNNEMTIFVMENGQEIKKIVQLDVAKVEINTNNGKVKIGNSTAVNLPFKGYIDYIAVFDYAITEDKIKQYPMNPPYIFEEGIRCLYCFSWEYPVEQVSQTAIELCDGAVVAPQIDTQNILTASPKLYIPDYNPWEKEQWEANIIFDAYSSLCMFMMGIQVKSGFVKNADTITASSDFVQFYKTCLAEKQEIKEIIKELGKFTDYTNLQNLFFNSEIASQLACICGVGGVAGTLVPLNEAIGIIGAVSAGVTVVIEFSKAMYEIVGEIIEKTPAEPTDDYGRIVSITFNTDRTGSVAVPIKDNTDTSNLLFISETVSAEEECINVIYEYIGENEYTVVLSGKNTGIIGNLEEQSYTFKKGETHTFVFKLKENTMKSKVCGEFIETIEWIENGKTKTTKTYNVYLLAKMPSSPWDITIEENSPTLNALKTVAQIAKYNTEPAKYSLEYIAGATVRWLRESGRFAASSEKFILCMRFSHSAELNFVLKQAGRQKSLQNRTTNN